jgi:hypothetical protein
VADSLRTHHGVSGLVPTAEADHQGTLRLAAQIIRGNALAFVAKTKAEDDGCFHGVIILWEKEGFVIWGVLEVSIFRWLFQSVPREDFWPGERLDVERLDQVG